MNVKYATLVANTPTTITLDRDYREIEVVNFDGAAAVYFTVGDQTDSAPTVAGTDSWGLPAAISSRVVPAGGSKAQTTVTLISAGTPKIQIIGLA